MKRTVIKNKYSLISLGGIVLISAAFQFLNFRITASNTQTTQSIMTTELEGNYPDRLQQKDKIYLVMFGEAPLVTALQNALTEQMDKAGMGQFELEQGLKPKYPTPILVIKAGKTSPLWTPFFAIGHSSLQAGYATNGDPTFMDALDKTQPYIRNPDTSVALLYIEYEIRDWSFGLISRPGYYQYLAEHLAQELVQALKNLYNIQDQADGNLRNSVE